MDRQKGVRQFPCIPPSPPSSGPTPTINLHLYVCGLPCFALLCFCFSHVLLYQVLLNLNLYLTTPLCLNALICTCACTHPKNKASSSLTPSVSRALPLPCQAGLQFSTRHTTQKQLHKASYRSRSINRSAPFGPSPPCSSSNRVHPPSIPPPSHSALKPPTLPPSLYTFLRLFKSHYSPVPSRPVPRLLSPSL
jgi:hypothetical protein